MVEARDARSVMASLVSFDTTHGETRFAPRGASIALDLDGQATAIGCHCLVSPHTKRQKPREGHYDAPDFPTRPAIPENGAETLCTRASSPQASSVSMLTNPRSARSDTNRLL